ncbi:FCGBP protein, partial [Halcyon senegalensis]|nr:FCGBP protein [Halcyon senegalensis]
GLVCPPHQHYELCGSSCHATCRGQTEPDQCRETTLCSEGCFCDPGFLRSGDRCVPLSACGCTYDGRYHQAGEVFFPDSRCQQRCRCRGDGTAECWPEGCGEEEECGVKDGVPGCYPRSCGRCEVLGAGGCVTFDRRRLRAGGSCTRWLAEVEEGDPQDGLVAFAVALETEDGDEGTVVRWLLVTAHGVTVGLERGAQWEVLVDGERHLLPLSLAEGALTVSQEGTHRVLMVQGGPKLLYDGDSYLVLILPSTYRGRSRGLCGNFNGDPADDVPVPEEMVTIRGTLMTNCTHTPPPPPPTCPVAEPGPCGVLTDSTGPFAG